MAVLLETTLGDIVVDLYTEERPKGGIYRTVLLNHEVSSSEIYKGIYYFKEIDSVSFYSVGVEIEC